VSGIGPSATALMRRLDALTDPERVEDANMLAAWREKYANKITVRTKNRWWRRLVKEARERARELVKDGGKGRCGEARLGRGRREENLQRHRKLEGKTGGKEQLFLGGH
ncbi:MAG: hypothetical protein IJG84_23600, partial [Kiritimatiellae bacterium]|nr:hypothetical protein [Kiritimatiellia bacterium]